MSKDKVTKITVLIPNYNGELYLEETLQSLACQSLPKTQFKIYLVDDGSTDGSLEIAKRYQEYLSNFSIHEFENIGITGNWNRAIQMVDTQLFTLLHCDDVYEPDYLSLMKELLLRHPEAALGHCLAQAIDSESKPIFSHIENYKKFRFFEKMELNRTRHEEYRLLSQGNYINCPSVMYRTEATRIIGAFNENMRQTQDWEYWLRSVFSGYPIVGLRKPLIKYRRHLSNASRSNSASMTRYREEYALVCWAHRHAVAIGWPRPLEKPDFSIIISTVAADIGHDLENGNKRAAEEKLIELATLVPSSKKNIIFQFLKLNIRLNKIGGKIIGLAINLAVFTTLLKKRITFSIRRLRTDKDF